MFKLTYKHTLLLAIFAFAFVYRITLLLWNTYPPGADIGFHAGVINSITQSGNTNFLYNFYQMGGGIELEFPGYHIFASAIIIMTGMTNYTTQAIIIALFSSLIVLATFLVTRIVWGETAAFIAAFFVAISRLDIEIVCFGGYPNIIVLLLTPVTFYLFLKRDKFSRTPYLLSTSLLAGAILLTHSLSAAVFVGIAAVTVIVAMIFPKMFNESRKNMFFWILPILIGAILVSPFLASAVLPYLTLSGTFTGATAIDQALLAARTVPLDYVLALFICIGLFFGLSKKYKGRFFSLPVFLLITWILVPLLLTQDYLVGFYVDSVRFPYFLIYPVIILVAVMTDYGARYFARVISANCGTRTNQSFNKKLMRILPKIKFKTVHGSLLIGFLLIVLIVIPIFRFPWDGFHVQSFYQLMDNPGYQAIIWAKQNTPVNSLFVADFGYAWWLAGFGQRPTITDVDLQASTLAREVSISKNVSCLLDTDYMIDNGYLQVREDGEYVGRHNPLFLADLGTNSPSSFFQFNSSETTLFSSDGKNTQSSKISDVPVAGMALVGAYSDSPAIVVNKGNDDFSYSEITTVTKGKLFANMTITVQSNKPTVSLDWLNIVVNSAGTIQQSFNNTLAMVDPATKECGQLIFAESQPTIIDFNSQNPCITQLSYSLQGKAKAEIQILVGMYPASETDIQNPTSLRETLNANLQNPTTAPDLPITSFDYKIALQEYNVTYVANNDFTLNRKYAADPAFSLAFINNEIAIFKVEANATQLKGS